MTTALECVDVRCVLRGVRALDGATLAVAEGEFVAVRGPNAAGKTSLLNAISGLLDVDGRIVLRGHNLHGLSDVKRAQLGVVRSFENNGICDNMSPVDNVALGLSRGSAWSRRRCALKWLNAVDAPSTPLVVAGLSFGQKRRVELARILARVEEFDGRCLVLLDEPFRGMDAESRQDVVVILKKHLCGRVTTIMVEHNAELADQLASRVVWMRDGRVTAENGPHAADLNATNSMTSPSTGSSALLLRNVRAGFGSNEVLHGIDLDIKVGESVRLNGRNGAGKSVLLRVVMGSLAPMSGEVQIFGRRLPDAVSRSRARVGYAAQGGRLVRQLTVGDHLDEATRVAASRSSKPSLGPAFLREFPEITELSGKRAGDLSSGQRSLVAVASAMTTEPEFLIADEPAAGLAPALADRLSQFLQVVWFSPTRTTVIVEHERFSLPGRTVCLERGEVV